MKILNDPKCGWITDLTTRTNITVLNKDENCDWLIIGAGFTGLSAARKLYEIDKKKKIIIVDAQLAGEGASGRNSGYLVDTTLNDGFTSNKDLRKYKIKTELYNLGINAVKKFIKEYQVDCDFNESGKYFASSNISDNKILEQFSKILDKLKFENQLYKKKELYNFLGTEFYNTALYTKGGILLNPGKLSRAMVEALPSSVKLYEYSQLVKWKKNKDHILCMFAKGNIFAKKIIFTTNGFLKSNGIEKNFNFPLTLTASMTRPLSDTEFENLGKPKEWGVLPVKPLGATVRLTKDRRILIRNTVEYRNPNNMLESDLKKRILKHKIGIKKRFPLLPIDIIQSSWSGIVSRSRNSSQIFKKLDKNIFAAGCYNGSGIGVATLFGEQIAIKAYGENSNEIKVIDSIDKPKLLPPEPLLGLGVEIRLMYEKIKSRHEI